MSEGDFELETVVEGIIRIELAPVQGATGLSRKINVYLVEDPCTALINAGHPGHADILLDALRACGVAPCDIERIIATSWRVDVVGGATRFPRADLFVLSPDMQAPRDLDSQLETERRALSRLGGELADVDDQFRRKVVDDAIDAFFPRTTRSLRFVPLRNGHFVQAGPHRLEVLATAGPGPGHMALYCQERSLLFCGDFVMSGLPDRLHDTRAYLVSLERLAELPSQTVLPNQGRTFSQGRWTVARAANFLNNFLTNAPAVLVRAPTVLEFIERDRGLSSDQALELLMAYRLFRNLFDELVRTDTIAAEGRGVERRYGVDVDDPRAKLRP